MSNEGLTLVRDRWYTALTADVTSAATSLPVVTNTVNGNALPTPCIVMCGFEQMYATASTSTTITVTRGFNSTAAAHAKGATVGIARVAAHHNDVVAATRPIAELVGTGASAVMEFASIPATYRGLMLRILGRSTDAATAIGCTLTFETTPTAGLYNYQYLYGSGSSALAFDNFGTSGINLSAMSGTGAGANLHTLSEVNIHEYANTGVFKSCYGLAADMRGLAAGNFHAQVVVGCYESLAAIDRIRLTLSAGSWTTTSRATLYGIPG